MSAVFCNNKGNVQKCEEHECYRDKRNKISEPAIVKVEYGEIFHRRSYEVEEVGVIYLERTVYPKHNEHYSEKVEHIVPVGFKSEGCLLADEKIQTVPYYTRVVNKALIRVWLQEVYTACRDEQRHNSTEQSYRNNKAFDFFKSCFILAEIQIEYEEDEN